MYLIEKLVISTGLRHNKLLLATSFTKVGQYNFAGVNIDSFSLVDEVNYDLDETTVLSANIHNFLDEDYVIASGFSRPGRTLFLEVPAILLTNKKIVGSSSWGFNTKSPLAIIMKTLLAET